MKAPIIIANLPKNTTEQVRVALDEYRGETIFDVRVCADFTAAHVFMPTKKGVAIRVEQLPEFAQAVADALLTARELGLIRRTGGAA